MHKLPHPRLPGTSSPATREVDGPEHVASDGWRPEHDANDEENGVSRRICGGDQGMGDCSDQIVAAVLWVVCGGNHVLQWIILFCHHQRQPHSTFTLAIRILSQ